MANENKSEKRQKKGEGILHSGSLRGKIKGENDVENDAEKRVKRS